MKRVLDLIGFEKDRITKAKEVLKRASEFEGSMRGGKETRIKFMGELYDSETILNRLEQEVKLISIADEQAKKNKYPKGEPYKPEEEQPQMFKELSIDELLKGLGAVLQPVPKKEVKSEAELRQEEFNKKLKENLMRDMLRKVNQNKKCVLLCDIVFEGNYYKTHRKVFDVLEIIGNSVIVDIGTYRGVPVPKECVSFL